MATRFHDRFFLVTLIHLLFISFTTADLLCHHFLTMVVRGVENHEILVANNFTFEKSYYERQNRTHFRVCICTKTNCLRKCCSPGQVFINKTCNAFDLDIRPEVYTEDLKPLPEYDALNFHRAYGNTCKQKSYELEPELYPDEEYFLIVNGSLVLPSQNVVYDPSQFCFENVLKSQDKSLSDVKTLRAFVCFTEETEKKLIVYPVGMIISMPFLLATFIVYSLPELRNLHGKNLMSEVASLLASYVILVITQLGNHVITATVCIALGFLLQYTFLATFFWLNVMCFDIWSTFSGFGKFTGHVKEKERKKYLMYSCYAWGCPTIILLVTVIMDYAPGLPDFIVKPNIGIEKCYFQSKMATLAYFYAPMAVIVICDIVLFVLTAIKIFKVRRETKVLTQNESRRNDEASKQRYNLYLKLFLVMGINWATEIISWLFEGPQELWYVTDFMNSLQGLFIFWIFVCNRKIKKVLKTKFCPRLASRETETNTSSVKISGSGNSSYPMTHGQSMQMSQNRGTRPGQRFEI